MGIFCMECHDMLMARRKKAKDQKTQNRKPVGQRTPGQSPSPMVLDKSLPSLPPSISVSSNEFPMPQVPLRDKESSSRGAAMFNELTTSRQSNSPDSIQRKPVAPSRSELHGIPASSIRNAAPEKGMLIE